MLVRVSSRLGVARIQIPTNSTIGELKQQIQESTNVPYSNQKLSLRLLGKAQVLAPDGASVSSFGIKNGEMVYLESPETSMSESEKKAAEKDAETAATVHSGDRASQSSGYASAEVKEDDIDVILRKQDGWVKRERNRFCNHPKDGKCSNCMEIAPWNVANHEEFADLNLKHVAFHAWLREKEYASPNNPVFLEDPVWKIDTNNKNDGTTSMVSARQSAFTVVLERQPYRHVDHVEFENPQMLDKFIQAWRNTGKQRCGYLLGKYIPEPSGIPLGIAALVSTIYEPPQRGTADDVLLLKDGNEAKIDEICENLGLVRVGFVWTALCVDANRAIIPDRDVNNYVLTSNECIRMCGLQAKYASPSRQSNSGKFGSKFVSVLLYGNSEGNIETVAYQMSNQLTRLVRDGVVRPTKQNPGFLRVRPSTPDTMYPDVVYSHKNEYNLMVQSKADPTFPNEFGIVSVRHSFPKDPNPLFKYIEFPIENRVPNIPGPASLKSALENKNGAQYVGAFSDFHLILYVALNLPHLLPVLAQVINKPGTVQQPDLKPVIDGYLQTALPAAAASSSAASSKPSSGPASTNSSRPDTPSVPVMFAQGQEYVKTLVGMGYTEKQSADAVRVTECTSLDAALNFILDS